MKEIDSGRNYVSSERAHFMCPNMHFGIMAHITDRYDEQLVKKGVEMLQKAHPFLQSLIAKDDTGKLYYQRQECLKVPVAVKAEYEDWQKDYHEVSSQGWDVRKSCLLKILVYPKENEYYIFFIAHHLLCDGRGLLQLAEEFAQYYVKGNVPSSAEERLIQTIQDLPPGSDLPFVSKMIINNANRRWEKEGQKVLYKEYADFERTYISRNTIERNIITAEKQELEEIQLLCRQQGISVNDYLIAKMMLEEDTNKVVIAADIRNQIRCYRPGAMGNYSTAFSVVINKKEGDIVSLAKKVSEKVLDIMSHPRKEMLVLACYLRMQPELIDAVAISTLGEFKSKAGEFVGKNMFGYGSQNGYSITNLGKMQSDVIAEAAFIPPASPANKKTLGVLTVNGYMKICSVVLTKGVSKITKNGV